MRIGIVSRTATYWPLYLLARDGAVELVELGSTAAGVDALVAGEVDVAATCPDALIASGAPLRIGGGLVDRPPTSIVAAPGIARIEDLRGKRIATTAAQGSVSIYLRAALRAHGLGRGDYGEVVCGPTPSQLAALQRGEVDAAMLTVPFDERAAAHGARRVADVGAELGPCAFTTLNVRDDTTATEEWRAFRSALVGAMHVLAGPRGRESAREALEEGTRGEVATAPEIAFDIDVSESGLARLVAWMREEGLPVRWPWTAKA